MRKDIRKFEKYIQIYSIPFLFSIISPSILKFSKFFNFFFKRLIIIKMKNKNKYEMKLVEEGYEDPQEAQLREAKRRLEEAKKPFNPLDIVNMKI